LPPIMFAGKAEKEEEPGVEERETTAEEPEPSPPSQALPPVIIEGKLAKEEESPTPPEPESDLEPVPPPLFELVEDEEGEESAGEKVPPAPPPIPSDTLRLEPIPSLALPLPPPEGQRLASPPPPFSSAGLPPTPPPPSSPPLARWLIALFMVAFIVIGLFLGDDSTNIAPRRPSVTTAYQIIEDLPPQPRVLIAWDYEPTTQGEMQLLAQPLLLHLQRRQAHLASVSLRPTGPAVAVEALRAAGAEDIAYNLGFLPGEASALRTLSIAPFALASQSPTQIAAQGWEPEADIAQFDLIIELSAETATTRAWVEQVATRSDTPLLVAASAAVAPALRPYEQSGQIKALLSGYTDALAYEQWLGESSAARDQRLAQTLARLFFLVIIILAFIPSSE
ncbi:MAG: hypothetical protein GXP38_07030, partial [Chloroflexi bacterium]|nr:hypothetical protein [Chloroflexota bacterium]